MSTIYGFDFENSRIRVQIDDAGLPWFIVQDVSRILGYADPRHSLRTRIDPSTLSKRVVPTAGGNQVLNHINEPGLYEWILRCRKPGAQRFKKWVVTKVLPSLRNVETTPVSSRATPTQDRVKALLMIGEAIARIPGVERDTAMAATLSAIHENTGIVLDAMRQALKPAPQSEATLSVSQVSAKLGWSIRTTQQQLAALGLQRRNDHDAWELTDAGRLWADSRPASNDADSGLQILWRPEICTLLQEVAP